MKKNIIALSLLMAFGGTCFAALPITIAKRNGGASGFRNVTETHTSNGHALLCTEPGNTPCTWDIKPTAISAYDALLSYAESQMDAGITSGTYSIANEAIDWSGSDIDNCDFSFSEF